MEYAKDEVFSIRYNEIKDKIEFSNRKWLNRTINKIKRHKFISTVILTLIIFSTINVVMIFNFMKLLQNI